MTRALLTTSTAQGIRNSYRHKLLNRVDAVLALAMDATNRKASSWTSWSFNDISGGTHTLSGTNDSNATYDAPTPASSRAIGALTVSVEAGKSYVVSVEVVSCTNPGSSYNTRQYLNGISGATGSTYVDIPNGVTGRYGYRFTANSDQSGLLLRFGAGASLAVDAASNIVLTKPMFQEVTDLTVPFSDWIDLPQAVLTQGGKTFSAGNSGAIIDTTDMETVATETNPFDFGIGIGDSFANDSGDWPQQLQLVSYGGTFHGKGYAGAQLTGLIGTNFAADIAQHNYGFVVIQGGPNDIVLDKTLAQLQTAIQNMAAAATGKSIIILGMPPWKTYTSWSSARQTVTDDYNAWLSPYCAQNGHIYGDLYTLLESPAAADELNPRFDNGDGLHLNTIGGRLVADYINRIIPRGRAMV